MIELAQKKWNTSKDQTSPKLAQVANQVHERAFWKAIRSLNPLERVQARPQLKNITSLLNAQLPTSNRVTPYVAGTGPIAGSTGSGIGFMDRLRTAADWVLRGDPRGFFPPGLPLQQQGPPDGIGRRYDYPFYYNIGIQPRQYEAVSFDVLRLMSESYDLMRIIMEAGKAKIGGQAWSIVPADEEITKIPSGTQDRIKQLQEFFRQPEGPNTRTTFSQWCRKILEDMFVLDAPALYVERCNDGTPYSLTPIDGGTICLKLDYYGNTPQPPEVAYQQVIKGLPGFDYDSTQLIYFPFCARTHKAYGYPVLEQVMTTINIGIRRQQWQLEYYKSSAMSPYVITTPPEWTPEQIEGAQSWWDSTFGVDNMAAKWRTYFLPNGCKPLLPADQREINLKDDMDDWLATVLCYAWSVDKSALQKMMNRASSQHAGEQAEDEGFNPYSSHLEETFTTVVQQDFRFEDCKFAFQGKKSDPNSLQAAQRDLILLNTGVLMINEARETRGLPPIPGGDQSPLSQGAQLVQLDEVNKLSDINEQKEQQQDLSTQQQQAQLENTKNGNQNQPPGGGNGKTPGQNGGSGQKPNGSGPKKPNGNGSKPVAKAFDVVPSITGGLQPFNVPRGTTTNNGHRPKHKRRSLKYTQAENDRRTQALAAVLKEAFQRQARRVAAQVNATRTTHEVTKAAGLANEMPFSDAIDIAITKALNDEVQDTMSEGWGYYFDLVLPIYQEAGQAASIQVMDSLPDDLNLDDPIVTSINEDVTDLASRRAARLLGMVVDSDTGDISPNPNAEWAVGDDVRDSVSKLVSQAEAEGWSNDDLADAIASSANFSDSRAETVARTELKGVDSEAAITTARGAGAQKKRWQTSADHDQDDECDENEAEDYIDIDDEFESGDDQPGAHPNCNCVLVFSWEEGGGQEGDEDED